MEYIVWGKAYGKTEEEPLFTKAESREAAEQAIVTLGRVFRCKDMRIQELDPTTPPDFAKVLNT